MVFPLGFLARLPYAMTPLGTLLLLQHATGSYAFAGAAAAAQSLAIGAGGVIVGRLADRTGIRQLGVFMAVANAVALAGLLAATFADRPTLFAAAVLVGATQPQVGPLIRVHWSYLAQSRPEQPGLMTTALSYEAAADEASFIAGPAVVGLLAATWAPVPAGAPLTACIVLLLAAAAPVALLYTTAPERMPSRSATSPLPRAGLAAMCAAMAVMGAIFGTVQVGVTAHATAVDNASVGGLLYAALGAGSAIASIAYAWIPSRMPLRTRYRLFALGLLIAMILLPASGTRPPLAAVVLVAGIAIAPYMITIYAITEQLAPTRAAITMTIVCAAGPVGTAAGQALAGLLVEQAGPRAPFMLPPVLAAAALLLAMTNRMTSANHGPCPNDTVGTKTEQAASRA
ncbi:MFS transporter [Micromonospora sp. 15K316]|uniref:MFS transporter n=1 Tax=Micromonospora sp. 15K316 TaxID=2530376 RepID=UPI00104B610B|nr:MFS transporter [Micromonospora sp. 15K316]TDC37214.1 MFS transporter [Micromonospora sp. 15K316]